MDCPNTHCAPGPGEITIVTGTPLWLAILTLVVSALAAGGTIWIASLNLRLVKQKAATEAEALASQRRMRRAKFARKVSEFGLGSVRVQYLMRGQEPWAASMPSREELLNEAEEESYEHLVNGVQRILDTEKSLRDSTTRDEIQTLLTEKISAIIDAWVSDPDNAIRMLEAEERFEARREALRRRAAEQP